MVCKPHLPLDQPHQQTVIVSSSHAYVYIPKRHDKKCIGDYAVSAIQDIPSYTSQTKVQSPVVNLARNHLNRYAVFCRQVLMKVKYSTLPVYTELDSL
jgi:hypothetical protein